MNLLNNPLIWILRVRHRCGYGVHSPFAFQFLTNVVYEQSAYYAYEELDKDLSVVQRMRYRKGLHLLFRLANWLQPSTIVTPENASQAKAYLQAGCKKAVILSTIPSNGADMILLNKPDDLAANKVKNGGILLLDNLHHNRKWLRNLPATLTFDLYDIGIAIYDDKLIKQHYIINFE